MEPCTFKPKINENNPIKRRTIKDLYRWEKDKKKRMIEREMKLEVENQKKYCKPFKPNKKSRELAGNIGGKVEDRLINYNKKKEENIKERKDNMSEHLFSPKKFKNKGIKEIREEAKSRKFLRPNEIVDDLCDSPGKRDVESLRKKKFMTPKHLIKKRGSEFYDKYSKARTSRGKRAIFEYDQRTGMRVPAFSERRLISEEFVSRRKKQRKRRKGGRRRRREKRSEMEKNDINHQIQTVEIEEPKEVIINLKSIPQEEENFDGEERENEIQIEKEIEEGDEWNDDDSEGKIELRTEEEIQEEFEDRNDFFEEKSLDVIEVDEDFVKKIHEDEDSIEYFKEKERISQESSKNVISRGGKRNSSRSHSPGEKVIPIQPIFAEDSDDDEEIQIGVESDIEEEITSLKELDHMLHSTDKIIPIFENLDKNSPKYKRVSGNNSGERTTNDQNNDEERDIIKEKFEKIQRRFLGPNELKKKLKRKKRKKKKKIEILDRSDEAFFSLEESLSPIQNEKLITPVAAKQSTNRTTRETTTIIKKPPIEKKSEKTQKNPWNDRKKKLSILDPNKLIMENMKQIEKNLQQINLSPKKKMYASKVARASLRRKSKSKIRNDARSSSRKMEFYNEGYEPKEGINKRLRTSRDKKMKKKVEKIFRRDFQKAGKKMGSGEKKGRKIKNKPSFGNVYSNREKVGKGLKVSVGHFYYDEEKEEGIE